GSTSVFFFSSRRRHTRSKRDWSSDVCSSDLSGKAHLIGNDFFQEGDDDAGPQQYESGGKSHADAVEGHGGDGQSGTGSQQHDKRSEERRVGKECMIRRWLKHGNKKI